MAGERSSANEMCTRKPQKNAEMTIATEEMTILTARRASARDMNSSNCQQ